MSVDVAELGLQVNARAGIQQNEAYDASLRRTTKTAMSLQGVLAQLGITISAGLTLRKVIQETSEAEHALSQLAAGIASTGGVAGRSMEDLVRLSEEIQATTKFSDEAAMGVEAMLLTFTKIRGAEFDDAVRAIADMGTRLGGIEGASLQVGKALNDPILGVTALGRAGVQFTESQKQMIEKLVEAGDVMGAQRVILSELETQFGGSARAARDTLGGSIEYLKNQFGDFFELTSEGSGEFQDAIESMGDAIPAITERLAELGASFSQNVLREEQDYALVLDGEGDLAGDVQVAGADAAVRMGHFAATFADMKRSVVEFIGEWAEFLHINPPALQSWIKDVKDEAFEAHRNLKFLEEVAADVISALGADAPKAEAFVATIDEVADAAARAASELSTLYTAVAAGAEQARAAAELEEFGRQILVRAAGEEAQARLAFIFERNRREQEVHEEALIREARAAEVTTEVWEDAAESIHDALKRAFKGSAEDAILAFSDLARDLVDRRRHRTTVQPYPEARQRIGKAIPLLSRHDQIDILEPGEIVLRGARCAVQTMRDLGQCQRFFVGQDVQNGWPC